MDSWDDEDDFSDADSANEGDSAEDSNQKSKENLKRNKRLKDDNAPASKKTKLENGTEKSGNIKKSKLKYGLYKPPTLEEMSNLRVTEQLFNNNLFRLEIEELIKEISIKNKRKKELSSWLETFRESLKNMREYEFKQSEIKSKKFSKKDKFMDSLATKYNCRIKSDQDLTLKLIKPESYESFGLYEVNSFAGPHLQASVNIKMPQTCFNVKDYLNNRYLVKRFYYMLYISEHIQAHKKYISYHDNNVLLPILNVHPTENTKLIVKIYVTPSIDSFKPSRFLPNSNNVKLDLFEANIKDTEVLKSTPTVLYNSVLAHDVTLASNFTFVKEVLSEHENVQEGIKLLAVWLRQRELDVGFGGFSEELVMYFVTYLLANKKVSKFMSSYQVIRNFWSFMASTDLQKNPVGLGNVGADTFEVFTKCFDIVFLDRTNCFNLTAFLNVEIYKRLKKESEVALKYLDSNKMEAFQCLFLTKMPFCLQYDLLLDVSKSIPLKDKFISTDEEKSRNIGFVPFLNINHLSNLLNRGLNKRILDLVPRIEVEYSSKNCPIKKVTMGINLNPDTAFNFIEMGPPLNEHVEADEFRKFWGYLSSDRRFRDGSTAVAVYFKTNTIRGRRGIIKRVIKYLLMEKIQIDFKIYYDEFESFLLNRNITSPYPIGTNEEATLKVINLADELGKKIRNFQMSLSITGIQGISDAFSFCQVFPPIAANFRPTNTTGVKGKSVIFSDKNINAIPRYLEPIELVLQLEHSSKWPNNLEGIRHIKTSFYLEISKKLQDHDIISHVTKEYLEVFFEGLVFRYKLYIPREVALLKRDMSDSGVTKFVDTEESLAIERKLNVLPVINGALKGLQLQYPSFGPATALIKRWLRGQLMDDFHVPDIVINLLSASLYVNDTGFAGSNTPQVAFLRFLKYISELQWEIQPVVVNFNEEISKEDITDLEARFQQNRNAIQPLYIITPYDQGQSLFTKKGPSRPVMVRVQQLAEVALKLSIDRMNEQSLFEIKELFIPNMEGYNLLIHLVPEINARGHEQIDSSVDNKVVLEKYVHHQSEKIPITGFNVVEFYLKTLRENYGDFATFFHDTYGGSSIGVLWNPDANDLKDFKVSNINGRKLIDNKLVLNVEAIVEDFYVLGKGLVKWIEKK